MIGVLASVIDGVLVGAVYGLAAMGLTLIWGVMNVINLAHGAMIVLGMFVVYFLATGIGLSPYATHPDRDRARLRGRRRALLDRGQPRDRPPELMSLLATFAANMILIGLGTALWTTSPYNVPVSLPGVTLAGLHLHRHAYHGRGARRRRSPACSICSSTTRATARRSAPSPTIARRPSSPAFRPRRCCRSPSVSASRSPARRAR